MKLVNDSIPLNELKQMAQDRFGDMVKAVVDVEREIMAVDAELHSDQEAFLLEQGSNNEKLWGINIYPDRQDENWIEFDSIINIRPWQNNRSRSVEDEKVRERIIDLVDKLVEK